jgi:hypothetical protein
MVVGMDSYTFASGWTTNLLEFCMTSCKRAVVCHCKHSWHCTCPPACFQQATDINAFN